METDSDLNSDSITVDHPLPHDFDNYFPYACRCLEIPGIVMICRQVQCEYISETKKSKHKLKRQSKVAEPKTNLNQDKVSLSDPRVIFSSDTEDKIRILPYYDVNENLVKLRFCKNKQIPCTMFKLLGFIVKFYDCLYSVNIDKGLNGHSLEELNAFLLLSHVTDVCLDDTRILDGEYHILLANKKLRQLSLCRCLINDFQVEKIASYLHYTSKCSETLSILNLATNKITDEGAKHLATALRSNRHLSYLNLCDNAVTDEGGISILDSLTEFLLTADEDLTTKKKYVMDLKRKACFTAKLTREVKASNAAVQKPKFVKKKSSGQFKLSAEKKVNVASAIKIDTIADDTKKYEIASAKANKELGDFMDPFSNKNTVVNNELRYCKGNTKLCYLNLAYNNLTLAFVNKLIKVLKYQNSLEKNYTGLLRVIVEGNQLPMYDSCVEMKNVSELLQAAVAGCFKKRSLRGSVCGRMNT